MKPKKLSTEPGKREVKQLPKFSSLVEHDLGSEVKIVATSNPETIASLLDCGGVQKARTAMYGSLVRDIEADPGGAYVVCAELENFSARSPVKLLGYAIAWVKGSYYHRLVRPDFPPELHETVKESIQRITLDHLQKVILSMHPDVKFGEPTQFEIIE